MNYTSDSSTEKTQKLANELQERYNIRCLPVQADMGSENGPAHIVEVARNHFSHPKTKKLQIDVVVNNAGTCHTKGSHRGGNSLADDVPRPRLQPQNRRLQLRRLRQSL